MRVHPFHGCHMSMKQVLVVEDSIAVSSLMKKKLMGARFSVVVANSLTEALVLIEENSSHFFAAILDFRLPDAPNGEIIDKVVAHGIPSIVFTGDLSQEVRNFVWERHVVDYVLKDNSQAPDYIIHILKQLVRNIDTKVMVVEDSGFCCKIISDLLKLHRFQVLSADNGEEALAILKENTDIKLVITDYNMPKMDGFRLTQKIRARYSREELAIIGISARGQNLTAARFIKYGANDFIIKQSFLTEEFYCRVNQCIDNLENIRKIREASVKDFLTGLHNRRYFFDTGRKLFASYRRKNITLVCAMLDIDLFKKVNDTYGHDTGDIVIQHIADILHRRMRETDIVARIGGEEFAILAVNVANESVEALFNELRQLVENTSVDIGDGRQLKVTISIGVALDCKISMEEMLKIADNALYAAKQGGRNQVAVLNSDYGC